MPRKKELSFEESLEKLEAIVKEMEGGDLTLKDLMSHYSEGVGLAKNCMGALERAEQTMDLLVKENEATGKVEESKLDIEG
ncbi:MULTISPECIES: exodeoxyribonuclease VII small subunit [Mitsuokella]|jgi:exodeoxyribonuclease VII small subunit|uniref:Exodeoxyribonuclease 7 small subunit n=1 Tax=Mitsuokella jalaludinii TaxID=187979 RepID=A0A173XHF8_9FIRM|nr:MULTISPECIES: exodeoxyribonuclease VII small subunit [Mitsuokella]MCB5724859.1 exodeoxyribonuclease VII small subunit [Mitsuokella jalaludinii]MCI6606686.1 exodeoxyribonuclease VII small subunit [Mitsuokella jalaludinii]MCI6612309.1 exodeoxyribonuclease VII small subunit [Mitsuokella jalaludinii]MCI7185474.1 exodeoxyribonuclease VII small subunit [Mitsuokella jalaludinii]MCQ1532864.1 exodeoxyribonuclease VII small subunit [Mitsuokella jalaludinii]